MTTREIFIPEAREPRRSFGYNFLKDLEGVAVGMATGIPHLAKSSALDWWDILDRDEKTKPHRLGQDARNIIQGFKESSFIVPLVSDGDVRESLRRFHKYPVSNTLDLTGATFGASRAARAAGVQVAPYLPNPAEAWAMKRAGYRRDRISELKLRKAEPIDRAALESEHIKFAAGLEAETAKLDRAILETRPRRDQTTGYIYEDPQRFRLDPGEEAGRFAYSPTDVKFMGTEADPHVWRKRSGRVIEAFEPETQAALWSIQRADSDPLAPAEMGPHLIKRRSRNELAAQFGDNIERLRTEYIRPGLPIIGNNRRWIRYIGSMKRNAHLSTITARANYQKQYEDVTRNLDEADKQYLNEYVDLIGRYGSLPRAIEAMEASYSPDAQFTSTIRREQDVARQLGELKQSSRNLATEINARVEEIRRAHAKPDAALLSDDVFYAGDSTTNWRIAPIQERMKELRAGLTEDGHRRLELLADKINEHNLAGTQISRRQSRIADETRSIEKFHQKRNALFGRWVRGEVLTPGEQKRLNKYTENFKGMHPYDARVLRYIDSMNDLRRLDQNPAVQQFIKYMRHLSRETETYAGVNLEQVMGAHSLVDNRARAIKWSGLEVTPEDLARTFFVPLREWRRSKRTYDKDADFIEGDPLIRMEPPATPGNPVELFFNSGFERNVDSIFDKHVEQLAMFQHNKFIDDITRMSTRIPTSVLREGVRKGEIQYTGHTVDFARGERGTVQAPLVAIDATSTVMGQLAHMRSSIDQMVEALRANGGTEQAINLLEEMDASFMGQIIDMQTANNLTGKQLSDAIIKIGERAKRAGDFELEDLHELGFRTHVIPREMYNALLKETARTSHTLLKIYDNFTEWWKTTVLHLRPRWIENNLVGSAILLALASGPASVVRAIATDRQWSNRAKEILGQPTRKVQVEGRPMGRRQLIEHFAPEVAGQSMSAAYRFNVTRKQTGALARYQNMIRKITEFNAKVADEPFRVQRMMDLLDQAIEAKGQMPRKQREAELGRIWAKHIRGPIPENFDRLNAAQAERLKLAQYKDMLEDTNVRMELVNETLSDMIDFSTMSKSERELLSRTMPFYTWFRGISKVATKAIHERPVTVAATQQIAQAEAERKTEELGRVGEFIRSGFIAPQALRDRGYDVIPLGGMNPFQTVFDIGAMFGHELSGTEGTGGESPASLIHPILKSGIEALTKKDLYFGTPLPKDEYGNRFATFGKRVTQIPLTQIMPWGETMIPGVDHPRVKKLPIIGQRGLFAEPSPRSQLRTDPMNKFLRYMAPAPTKINYWPALAREWERERELRGY